jgi:hypothetical protein
MKNKLGFLAVALIAGGTMFAQPRVSIGIGVGGYAPGYYAPPIYSHVVPAYPGPGYAWVDGYWVPQGGRNVWIQGYWRRPVVSAYPVGPRFGGPAYYGSYRAYGRDYNRGYAYRGGGRIEYRGNGFRR